MSALPPKADVCGATGDACYGPKADMSALGTNSQNPGQKYQDQVDLDRIAGLEKFWRPWTIYEKEK
jgi:hypothetical protein